MRDMIYVTGHQNPDTDSVCSAIAMADFQKRKGLQAIACCQGPLNEETKFALKRFHQDNPFLLTDARMTLREIELDQPVLLSKHTTVHEAWNAMIQANYRSLMILDDEGNLCGICTTSNLSRYRLQGTKELQKMLSAASLEQIVKTVSGTAVVAPVDFRQNGHVTIVTLEELVADRFDLKGGITVLSSGIDKQKTMIEMGSACLVITCGVHANQDVLSLAAERNCAVVETDLDTMTVAQVITEAYSVEHVMTTDLICFNQDEYISDVAVKMSRKRIRNYPVLDETGKVVAAVSRYHTLDYQRRKVILVDHSTRNQTLKHIEDARLIAIVDHHHLGNLETNYPIDYRNERIGCTSTILSKMYRENHFLPGSDIAGVMLSAIISDTLNFKSTTTTEEDKEAARWLAEIAGIDDIDNYARDLLGASVSLIDSTPHEILNRDLKQYEIGSYRFAIGQTNYKRIEEVHKILPSFRENLKKEQEDNQLDLLVMAFTDVMGGGSMLVYEGPLSHVMATFLETVIDDHTGYDTGIISRKQQLMPKLSAMIQSL